MFFFHLGIRPEQPVENFGVSLVSFRTNWEVERRTCVVKGLFFNWKEAKSDLLLRFGLRKG